jgi:hypothetical protein
LENYEALKSCKKMIFVFSGLYVAEVLCSNNTSKKYSRLPAKKEDWIVNLVVN